MKYFLLNKISENCKKNRERYKVIRIFISSIRFNNEHPIFSRSIVFIKTKVLHAHSCIQCIYICTLRET